MARVSADAVTPGTSFIDVIFLDGDATERIFVQGVRGATGAVTVTASSALFTDGVGNIEVVQSGFVFESILTSTNTLAEDDPFAFRTYSTQANGTTLQAQQVSAEGPLTVTLTSSDTGVGVLTTIADPATSPVTVEIAVNKNLSPGTVAALSLIHI